jgi:hypothetical protein
MSRIWANPSRTRSVTRRLHVQNNDVALIGEPVPRGRRKAVRRKNLMYAEGRSLVYNGGQRGRPNTNPNADSAVAAREGGPSWQYYRGESSKL